MREICPATNATCEQFLEISPPEIKNFVTQVRKEKRKQIRSMPSSTLIDNSEILSRKKREELLDKIASLVDENLFGRNEMCRQFSILLTKSLQHLNIEAKYVEGSCSYYNQNGDFIYTWEHAWVRIGKEVADGNIDSSKENPLFPKEIDILPYWGLINKTPKDRKFKETALQQDFYDTDVEDIWWPELKQWLDNF